MRNIQNKADGSGWSLLKSSLRILPDFHKPHRIEADCFYSTASSRCWLIHLYLLSVAFSIPFIFSAPSYSNCCAKKTKKHLTHCVSACYTCFSHFSFSCFACHFEISIILRQQPVSLPNRIHQSCLVGLLSLLNRF